MHSTQTDLLVQSISIYKNKNFPLAEHGRSYKIVMTFLTFFVYIIFQVVKTKKENKMKLLKSYTLGGKNFPQVPDLPSNLKSLYHVQGPVNQVYSEILLSRICACKQKMTIRHGELSQICPTGAVSSLDTLQASLIGCRQSRENKYKFSGLYGFKTSPKQICSFIVEDRETGGAFKYCQVLEMYN